MTYSRRLAAVSVLAIAAVIAAASIVFAPSASAADTDDLSGVSPIVERTDDEVTADALPTVQIDSGIVWTQVVVGDIVYAGGSFSNARPAGAAQGTNLMARQNLLAFNINTGVATSFAPEMNGTVKSLAASPDGKTLYVGGSFTKVNGKTRHNFAAFSTATGELLSFSAPVGGSFVNAIVATDSVVYIGGWFSQVNGQARSNLAAVSTSGQLLAWAPTTNHQVDAMVMAPDADKLVVAGRFSQINGVDQFGTSALDLQSAAVLPYAVSSIVRNGEASGKAGVWGLSADDENVYGTGWAYYANDDYGKLEGTFAASGESGDLVWQTACRGDNYGVYSDGTTVYTTSHAHNCAPMGAFPDAGATNMRNALAFTTEATGTQIAQSDSWFSYWNGTHTPSMVGWYPDWYTGTASGMGQAGWSIVGNGDYVVYGGEFVGVNGQSQQGLVRFATNPSSGKKQGPRLSGTDWGTPTASSPISGTVRVSIPANWDRDDLSLTYEVRRQGSSQILGSATVDSTYWNRPTVEVNAVGLTPGASETLVVVVRDGDGNAVTSNTVTVTVSDTVVSDYAEAVVLDGASLYWPLGGSTGGEDLIGTNDAVNGALVGSVAQGSPAGDGGPAATYPGTGSTFSRTTTTAAAGSTFATELWFKTTTTSGGKLVGYGNSASGSSGSYDRHVYMTNSGRLVFGVYPGSVKTIQSSASYNDGEWHQVVAQLGASGMELYVDGKLVASDVTVTSAQSYTGYWRLGGDSLSGWTSRPSSDYFSGAIDEFAVYGKTLTAEQIGQHFALASGSSAPTADFAVTGDDLDWAFDASASEPDEGRTIASYAWDFGDGETGSGETAEHAYDEAGSYTVTLTVTDDLGLSAETTQTVTAEAPHVAPTADIETSVDGLTVTVDGSGSSADGSATITDYAWDFGDGETGTGETATHEYAEGGTYTVTLTVTDSEGLDAEMTAEVTVVEADVIVSDDFERSVTSGWGTAPVGGTWTGTSGLSVQDGEGVVTVSKTQTRNVALSGSWDGDVDASFSMTLDRVLAGGGLHASYVVHRTSDGEYRVKVRTLSSGAVTITLTKLVGGTESNIATASYSGYTLTAGDTLNVRLQTEKAGAGTTLRAKVWSADATEPDWQVTGTDSTAALQNGGTSGFVFYATSTATNGPLRIGIDNLLVTSEDAEVPEPVAPTADFTADTSDLDLSVDGSASEGEGLSYAWDFGDGETGTGETASHTYAEAGTYSVALVVTSTNGLSSTAKTESVTVTAPPEPGAVVTDAFDRTVSSGWGNAAVGGTWTTSSGFSVAGGTGKITTTKSQTKTATLNGTSALDVDARASFGIDTALDAGNVHTNLVVRKTDAGEYRLKLRFFAGGSVSVAIAKVVGGTETVLAIRTLTEYEANALIDTRLQVTTSGSSTTLTAKVWQSDADEPSAWQLTATDSTAALQTAGAVGISTYVSGSTTGGPFTILVDDLSVEE